MSTKIAAIAAINKVRISGHTPPECCINCLTDTFDRSSGYRTIFSRGIILTSNPSILRFIYFTHCIMALSLGLVVYYLVHTSAGAGSNDERLRSVLPSRVWAFGPDSRNRESSEISCFGRELPIGAVDPWMLSIPLSFLFAPPCSPWTDHSPLPPWHGKNVANLCAKQ